MADLIEIVKAKAQGLAEQNIYLAREKCSQADRLVMKARASGGTDKELVKELAIEAIKLYKEALEFNSKQIQPYIGIAYISYSAGDLKTAIAILNQAEELDPLNEQVIEMLTVFRDEHRHNNISAIVHKVAGKSLAESLKTDEHKEHHFMDKITGIFLHTAKNRNVANNPVVQTSIKSGNGVVPPKTQSTKETGNFFENMRDLSARKK